MEDQTLFDDSKERNWVLFGYNPASVFGFLDIYYEALYFKSPKRKVSEIRIYAIKDADMCAYVLVLDYNRPTNSKDYDYIYYKYPDGWSDYVLEYDDMCHLYRNNEVFLLERFRPEKEVNL